MENQEHLDILRQGGDAWNQWRREHPNIWPDLREAHFKGADLREINFNRTNLKGANLEGAHLEGANFVQAILFEAHFSRAHLEGANLNHAQLNYADLFQANLHGADLSEAALCWATLDGANLDGANLEGANLMNVRLVGTNLKGANLTGCSIHGISAWNVQLKDTIQTNLIITRSDEPTITIDNLEVAQFIYLLLNNEKIRDVIDTITSKVVLILGRFTPERKVILDALREELREQNYLPVLFDFEKPASRDLTETVSTLAHLARFIIVDLTDPSSAPYEVATIIPQTVVPVQPLLLREPLLVDGKAVERREFAMFEDLRRRHHWVLPTFRYQDTAELLASLQAHIMAPAEQKASELTQPK